MKTPIVVGNTVECVLAASSWHTVGQTSIVVAHHKSGLPAVLGSDGFQDELCICSSKFRKIENA